MLSIVKSHFRKGKTGFAVTALFVVLSVAMMIVGMSIVLGMKTLYLRVRDITHSPDLYMYVGERFTDPSGERIVSYLDGSPDVESYAIHDIYYCTNRYAGSATDCEMRIEHASGESTTLSDWQVHNLNDPNNPFLPNVRSCADGDGYKMYVTGNLVATSAVRVGDRFVYRNGDRELQAYIAGIFDDVSKVYSSAVMYVEEDLYRAVESMYRPEDKSIWKEYVVDVRVKGDDADTIGKVQEEIFDVCRKYEAELKLQNPHAEPLSYGGVRRTEFENGTRAFILLLGTAMTGFAVIVAAIVALVIAFLVRSSVLDEVRNLGVWKALGYTTAQLRRSYLTIYAIIGTVCAALGVALGVGLMPVFVRVITMLARVDCGGAIGVHGAAIATAVGAILAIVAAVVCLATARVKRVTPLSAMRSNLSTHTFRVNRAPLAQSRLPINAALGVKSIVGEKQRSLMVVAIVCVMSLLCGFVSVVYYNLKVDQSAVIDMCAIENADYYFGFYGADAQTYFDAIEQMPELEASAQYSELGMYVRGKYKKFLLFEDFDLLRTKFLCEGVYPQSAGEILISEQEAKRQNVRIGDMIAVQDEIFGQVYETDCIITGYFQSLGDLTHYIGSVGLIDRLGLRPYMGKYELRVLYFRDGCVPSFDQIDALLRRVSPSGKVDYLICETGESMIENLLMGTLETAANAAMQVFIAVTFVVVALLAVMLIKLKLLRERRNYAIYKALGYTTRDIMVQIALTMTVLAALGSIVGGVVGALATSPLLSALGSLIGAGRFAFRIPWGYIAAIAAAISAAIYAVSMLCAIPVRKIRPAEMLRERG